MNDFVSGDLKISANASRSDVLELSCEEALGFFSNQPAIARHMQTIVDVGLGYVRLGQPAPRVALSNARTQWGVCTEGGSIRLSWRLVHIDPSLADYVVAHETAHLVELNHSRRFWTLVAGLYPGWQEARERLELAGAALPIFPRNS